MNKKTKFMIGCFGILSTSIAAATTALVATNNAKTNHSIENKKADLTSKYLSNKSSNLFTTTKGRMAANAFFRGENINGQIDYAITNDNCLHIIGYDHSSEFSGTNISFNESVTINGVVYPLVEINDSAFEGCVSLVGSVSFSNSIKTIGTNAFKKCAGISNVDLSNAQNLQIIEKGAFENIGTDVESQTFELTIPSSLVRIGKNAFCACEKISKIDFSNATNLKYIETNAFEDCTGINGEIIIPDSLQIVDNDAFNNCANVSKLVIGEQSNLIEIGTDAFNGVGSNNVASEVNVSINQSVTFIGKRAFSGCNIKDVKVDSSLFALASNVGDAKVLISTSVVRNPNSKIDPSCSNVVGSIATGNLTLDDSIEQIDQFAFSGCNGITNVELPNSLRKIEAYAFSGCKNLEKATWNIPESVYKIGSYAFSGSPSFRFLSETAPKFDENWAPNNENILVEVPYSSTGKVEASYKNAANFGDAITNVQNGLDFFRLDWKWDKKNYQVDDSSLIAVTPNKGIAPSKTPALSWGDVVCSINGEDQNINSIYSEYVHISEIHSTPMCSMSNSTVGFKLDFIKSTQNETLTLQSHLFSEEYEGKNISTSSKELVIYNKVNELKFDKNEINAHVNETVSLTAEINADADPEAEINWTADKENVLRFPDVTKTGDTMNIGIESIPSNGVVTLTAECNGVTSQIKLNITNAPSTSSNNAWIYGLVALGCVLAVSIPFAVYGLLRYRKNKNIHAKKVDNGPIAGATGSSSESEIK